MADPPARLGPIGAALGRGTRAKQLVEAAKRRIRPAYPCGRETARCSTGCVRLPSPVRERRAAARRVSPRGGSVDLGTADPRQSSTRSARRSCAPRGGSDRRRRAAAPRAGDDLDRADRIEAQAPRGAGVRRAGARHRDRSARLTRECRSCGHQPGRPRPVASQAGRLASKAPRSGVRRRNTAFATGLVDGEHSASASGPGLAKARAATGTRAAAHQESHGRSPRVRGPDHGARAQSR